MAGKQFILDLPSGTEFSIEDFVRMVNKNLKTKYTVRAKEGEELGTINGVINKLHNRIVRIEDYINDWTESQVTSNEVTARHLAIINSKITELDSWANTVINDTNRVLNEINAYDPEGTRKYIFGVLDNVVKEISDQRKVMNYLLDFISSDAINKATENVGTPSQQPKKRGRGRPKKPVKSGKPVIKLTKQDIKKAKEELAKLESGQQPQKRKRGRPKKTEPR